MVVFRPASVSDLETLEHWDEQEHVIASDPEEEDWEYELSRSPSWRQLLIAEVDGKPIGCVQVIDPYEEDTYYWGSIGRNKRAIDIWIGEKDDLNKGYGTQMMQQAIEMCFSNRKVVEILIDPLSTNHDAIRFYKRLGFEFVEHRTFNQDVCEVYALTRTRWSAHQKQLALKHTKG